MQSPEQQVDVKWKVERDPKTNRITKVEGPGDLALSLLPFVAIDDLNLAIDRFEKISTTYAKRIQWLTVALLILTIALVFGAFTRL